MSSTYDKLVKIVKETPRRILKAAIEECDGWTIFPRRHFDATGLSPEVVAFFDVTHKDGDSWKEKITGNRHGVYGLQLLRFIAECFGVHSTMNGRGSEAEELKLLLRAHWITEGKTKE